MDYFQSVVTTFLRADRSVFINTECLIQLEEGRTEKNRHWYCDAMAVNFRKRVVYLCEVTYATSLTPLVNRLRSWATHWDLLRAALIRDCNVPPDWHVQPWVFIPREREEAFRRKWAAAVTAESSEMPDPLITCLETVAPWTYHGWDRREDRSRDGE